jgi:hypothetical protein
MPFGERRWYSRYAGSEGYPPSDQTRRTVVQSIVNATGPPGSRIGVSAAVPRSYEL